MTEAQLPFQQAKSNCHSRFSIYDVDYYPNTSSEELPSLLNQGYRYLILDMGSMEEVDLPELLRCDKKIILGSLAPWKMDKFRNTYNRFSQTISSGEGFIYLMESGNPKTLRKISGTYHIIVRSVPFIQNPFRIGKEFFSILQELLE